MNLLSENSVAQALDILFVTLVYIVQNPWGSTKENRAEMVRRAYR
jgi:hypothetical protein